MGLIRVGMFVRRGGGGGGEEGGIVGSSDDDTSSLPTTSLFAHVFSRLLLHLCPRRYSSYRTPMEGLYLCGAGTHPGGGVMGAPGRNCANVILSDKGIA